MKRGLACLVYVGLSKLMPNKVRAYNFILTLEHILLNTSNRKNRKNIDTGVRVVLSSPMDSIDSPVTPLIIHQSFIPGLKRSFSANPFHCSLSSSALTSQIP